MKKFLFLILAILMSGLFIQAYGQSCTPDAAVVDTAEPGQISPDSLPPATQGEYYDETITIIPPGSYEGLDIIYSIVIDSIVGLPPGINWYKNEAEFLVTDPDTRYCVNLYGTPTEQGTFPLTLYITPYIDFFGTPVASAQQVDDTSMSIFVDAPVSIADLALKNKINAYPNPFAEQTEIQFYSNEKGTAELIVYNLLGNILYKEKLRVSPGNNTFLFNGSNLSAGSYIYSIRMNDYTELSRLMKSE